MLLASGIVSMFLSCQSAQEEASASQEQHSISFTVKNYRQVSFDDLSGSADTRAVASNHPSTLAHLLIVVFNAETGEQACSPIQHDQKNYEENNEAYPKFTLTLPYGHYRVLVLGYNGSQGCRITSASHISWENDYVPNSFYYCEDFTFDQNTSPDRKITLKHAVAAFRVETEDALPAELKKMRFSSTIGGTVLDATTGFTPQSTGRTSEIAVPADSLGKPGILTVYLFLPNEEENVGSYTVQALGKNNDVLYEKRFSEVPMRINYMTLWQGKFFEDTIDNEEHTSGVSLYWDTQWADTIRLSAP